MSAPADDPGAAPQRVRVWDLPTRLFHWLLVLTVLGLFVTGKVGGNAMEWHMRLGLMAGVLIGFRLVWGLVGGRWSRFASFLYGPAAVLRYLRGRPLPSDRADVGHNPLGAGSVFAMLGLLAVQVGTGLVSDDEIATTGPLNRYVSSDTASTATAWHGSWGQWLLIALVLLHVAAIVVHRLKGHDLVRPMLTGDKQLPAEPVVPSAADGLAQRLLALLLLAAWLGLAAWVWRQHG